jgi:hypothetical protein
MRGAGHGTRVTVKEARKLAAARGMYRLVDELYDRAEVSWEERFERATVFGASSWTRSFSRFRRRPRRRFARVYCDEVARTTWSRSRVGVECNAPLVHEALPVLQKPELEVHIDGHASLAIYRLHSELGTQAHLTW